jgi:hypothetical protein
MDKMNCADIKYTKEAWLDFSPSIHTVIRSRRNCIQLKMNIIKHYGEKITDNLT